MPPIDQFLRQGTRRFRVLQALAALAYGERGVSISRNGSILSPEDCRLAYSPRLRPRIAGVLWYLIPMNRVWLRSRLVRIGGSGDGSYPIVDVPVKAVVSAGTCGNDSFDLEMANRRAVVLQVDNSQDSAPSVHPRMKFIRATVGGRDGELGIPEMRFWHQSLLGPVDDSSRWILKVDIEGSEWSLFAEAELLDDWDQIVVEFHELDLLASDDFYEVAIRGLENISRTHVAVSLHGNSCCGFVTLGGISVPRVLEVTFVRRDADVWLSSTQDSTLNQTAFPDHGLSNVSGRADLWPWGLSPFDPTALGGS